MKLLWFLIWREIRTRWRNLLPFMLISAALLFTASAQVTFQECLDIGDETFDYMTSPTYLILLTAFALIGFVTAKTYFILYSDSKTNETGIKRALGLKRRDIRRARLLLGSLCITVSTIIAVPLALLYIYLFVHSCASGNMILSDYTPLVYRIPYSNILRTLFLLIPSMMCGVLCGTEKEKSIVYLLRRGKIPLEAENGNSSLPEEGNLRDYGRLFVRRSVKRCIRYNMITVFLLILPMFYLLVASAKQVDYSSHSFELYTGVNTEKMIITEISEEMLSAIHEIPGVSEAILEKVTQKKHADYIKISIQNETDYPRLREEISRYASEHFLRFKDVALIRQENNAITRYYQFFFLTHSAILFAVACLTSFALLKSRLSFRKRELLLLRALGARTDAVLKAVIPETAADCVFGSVFSVALGGLGFAGAVMDGGGVVKILPILVLCLLFLAGNVCVQIHASKRITRQILTEPAERL